MKHIFVKRKVEYAHNHSVKEDFECIFCKSVFNGSEWNIKNMPVRGAYCSKSYVNFSAGEKYYGNVDCAFHPEHEIYS